MRTGAAAAIAALALLAAAPAEPAEIEGVVFRDQLSVADAPLRLHATGLLRKFFIKGYVAALYLGPGAAPARVLEDVPKRLEIEYFRSIQASAFGEAGDQFVARNVDAATLERLRPRLDRLNALYRDVDPGDRYALTYLPGWGTELSMNGEPLGRIPGADFARGVFSIWLGADPIDLKLKQRLLAP